MAPARPIGPAPDRQRLHDAALRHLARFAATEAGLVRVLDRRVDRWIRAAGKGADAVPPLRRLVREVAAALVASGVVNDAAFAEARARSLTRAGRSSRAVQAHLAAKGVPSELSVLPSDPEQELAAALAHARRRRLGPFAAEPADQPGQMRALGAMARAGFTQEIARRALAMDVEEALDRVIRLKQA